MCEIVAMANQLQKVIDAQLKYREQVEIYRKLARENGVTDECINYILFQDENTLSYKGDFHKVHILKVTPNYYHALKNGIKNFELRINDRDFQVGDTVHLNEWNGEMFTGNGITKKITYMLEKFNGLQPGFCILGLD